MNRVVFFAACAGMASVGAAQNFSLSLVPSISDIHQSQVFTVDVYGDADVGTHMLGGSFALESDGQCITDMQWNSAPWSAFNTDGGFAGDGDYNEIIFGQLIIPGVPPFDIPAPGSELGSLIGSFTVFLDQAIGDTSITFQLVEASPFSLEVIDINTGETFQSSNGNLSLGSATITGIPTPGTIPIFAGLGLLASRRRRIR